MMHTACALIVSSDYEGHSVVTLEARVLDLPVVSTDYPSVRGVLPEGVGVVVPPSADGVAEGMRRALEGTVPHPSFDADQHNSDALDRFRTVICGVTEARKHD
jgi:glycosyltransferase involved in cell wall biosynthesis